MKRSITVVLTLLASMALTAATVSKDEARQKALQFLGERGNRVAAARGMQPVDLQLKDGLVTDELYVFNVGQRDGFVIMSADDCTGDLVLGYADEGEIRTDNMPDNLRAWLQGYADQIRWMQQHGVKNSVAASRAAFAGSLKRSISPLLETQWNQSAPYNNNCPIIEYVYSNAPSEIKEAATGCVATATAQLMYYQGKKMGVPTTMKADIPSYKSNKTSLIIWANDEHTSYYTTNTVDVKPAKTFDWAAIPAAYYTANGAETEEVASLMEYIGAGVQMQYGSSSSASNESVVPMLVNYFGYDADAKTVYRDNYTYEEWLDVIYQELANNGPVLFGGQSLGGGHAFLLDGYSEDDFFHVNWGWGGMSDGNYRLSALNPSDQGIGGSSSTDGYNFDQCIMIDVNPVDDGISQSEDVNLTVNTWSGNRTSMTVYNGVYYFITNNTLYPLEIQYSFTNNSGSSAEFEWGFAFVKDGEIIKVLDGIKNNTLSTGSGIYGTTSCHIAAAGLTDGEYRIVAVSRKAGTSTWHQCVNSDFYYIKAAISGENMTLQNVAISQNPDLSATLELSGAAVVNEPTTIIAKISNAGYQYNGKVQLIWKSGSSNYLMAVRHIDVESGATNKEFAISFTPTSAGDRELILLDKNNVSITTSSKVITVGNASTATTGTLGIVSTVLKNGNISQGEVYGSTAQATVTVENRSGTNHTSGIRVGLYRWVNVGGGYLSGTSIVIRNYDLTVPANSQVTLDVDLPGMEIDDRCNIIYSYMTGQEISRSPYFYCVEGTTVYRADGTSTAVQKQSSVTTPADAAAIDVTGVTSVTPNSNPNTLYIVRGGSAPSGLDGKNVVVNGVAESLALQDGYDFFSPVSFEATTATYTRQFSGGAGTTQSADGWSTIILPFDVTAVKQGTKDLDWFHSASDTGKNFWLKSFSSESGSTVNFEYADEFLANTPYIIAVPNDTWSEEWALTGKDITFQGSNVAIAATAGATISGNNYKFTGASRGAVVTDGYVLNAAGNTFEKSSTTVPAFRAYFKPVELLASTPGLLASCLFIGSETTDIKAIDNAETAVDRVYNLNGQRVNQPSKGLYIVNGKKIVVK